MSENEIRVLYVQPGKYPEERTTPNPRILRHISCLLQSLVKWRESYE